MTKFHIQNNALTTLFHDRKIKLVDLFEWFIFINKNLLFGCDDVAIHAFAIDSIVVGVRFFVNDYSVGENEFSLVDGEVLLAYFVSYAECWVLGIDQMTAPKLVSNTIMKLWNHILLFKFVKLNKLPGNWNG